MYINDLSEGLHSNLKFLINDTSVFSVVRDLDFSQNKLNEELAETNSWVYQYQDRSKRSSGTYIKSKSQQTSIFVVLKACVRYFFIKCLFYTKQ